MPADRETARQEIMETIAADCACDPAVLAGDGITVVEWHDVPGRRRFEMPAKPYQLFTAGHALVVSCHADWMAWTRERVASLDSGAFLAPANLGEIASLLQPAGLVLVGPHVSYGCSTDTLRPARPPSGVELEILEGPALEDPASLGDFPNALPTRVSPLRPNTLAVMASVRGRVVACAAASDDNGQLWQIGVDVLAPWRGRGIGRAVVHRLTEAVLDAGKVPYYSHSVSNVRSAALATSLGFWPAWVQWYALEQR